MITTTDYGDCELTQFPCVELKPLIQQFSSIDHIRMGAFGESPQFLDHVEDFKVVKNNNGDISYQVKIPTLTLELVYKMDGTEYMINYEYVLYDDDIESLEKLEKLKDTLWSQDTSEELCQEILDIINCYHNGYGCECFDY
tara:strand:- start:138 stop:560 length:423 start_codon:yes stop_codon:yes gene_type:complete